MIVVNVVAGFAGAALVLSSLADLFASVVVPRSVGGRYRPSALLSRFGWRLWRGAAMRIADQERREDTLAVFAPTLLVTLLGYWVLSQVIGYVPAHLRVVVHKNQQSCITDGCVPYGLEPQTGL